MLVAGSGLIIRLRKDTVGSNPTRPTKGFSDFPASPFVPQKSTFSAKSRGRQFLFSGSARLFPRGAFSRSAQSWSTICDRVASEPGGCRRTSRSYPSPLLRAGHGTGSRLAPRSRRTEALLQGAKGHVLPFLIDHKCRADDLASALALVGGHETLTDGALPISRQPNRPVALRRYLAIKDVHVFHAIPGLFGDFELAAPIFWRPEGPSIIINLRTGSNGCGMRSFQLHGFSALHSRRPPWEHRLPAAAEGLIEGDEID